MKKIITICVFFILVSASMLSMSSCSNELPIASSNAQLENIEFTNLLKSLDQIGQLYAPTETRGSGLTKWGGRIFSATVDGITGYISGPAGIVVGTLCSWAFDEHWERCNRKLAKTLPIRKVMGGGFEGAEPLTYVNCIGVHSKEDSIGYYHNLILNDLANSGKKYELPNGNIDYQSILNDCMEAAEKYGVNLNISKSDKQKFCVFSEDVVEMFTSCGQEKITLDDAFSGMNNSYTTLFGFKSNISKVETVQKKIIDVLNEVEDTDKVINYADQVYEILGKANISNDLKADLKTVTSVTVNSKLYWTTNEYAK